MRINIVNRLIPKQYKIPGSVCAFIFSVCFCSAANSCPASPKADSNHMNITDNLKMAAAYAAKVQLRNPAPVRCGNASTSCFRWFRNAAIIPT